MNIGDAGMYLRRVRVLTRHGLVSGRMTAFLFLAFVLGGTYQVAAMSYGLNILVKNGDTIGGTVITLIGGTGVSLNNARHVAFLAQIPTGLGIFTQDTLLAQSGDVIGGKTLATPFTLGPSLNNVGDVAFLGFIAEGGEGVFTQNKLLARTGDTIGGKTLTSILSFAPQLNDHGEVVFVAEFAGGQGIFTPQSLLVQTGDTIDGKIITEFEATSELLSLNNAGEVAFAARFVGGRGIFTQHALLAQIGDTISGHTLVGVDAHPSINDSGEVVFLALYTDDGELREGLFTPAHLLVGDGSIIEGRTIEGFAGYDLNNAGDVAFNAGFDGTAGIIVNNTIVAELSTGIIGTGGVGTPSLNDKREVAFEAVFQDRTRGIVLALPVTLFATFTATLDLRLAPRINDAFDLESDFTLGTASDGLDPLTEEVILELIGVTGIFTTTIPAGSFTEDKKGHFTFKGEVDGVKLDATVTPLGGRQYAFTAAGKQADLSGITNPVTVTLTIGNDSGSAPVTASVKGQERRADHGQ